MLSSEQPFEKWVNQLQFTPEHLENSKQTKNIIPRGLRLGLGLLARLRDSYVFSSEPFEDSSKVC